MPAPSADMANFTPIENDYSVHHLLSNTFGEITGNVFGAGDPTSLANVMGVAFAYFNSAVLFFGTVILAYVTVFGIMNTANDGKVLGKKWSTAYTPLRIASAAGALLPTSSGYSIIQLIVMQIIAWGVGIADTTWTKVAEAAVDKSLESVFVAMPSDTNVIKELAAHMLEIRVCEKVTTDALTKLDASAGHNVNSDTPVIVTKPNGTQFEVYRSVDRASVNWAGNGPDSARGAICGEYSFPYKYVLFSGNGSVADRKFQFKNMQDFTATSNTLGSLQLVATKVAINANKTAFNAMDEKLKVLAEQIVNDTLTPPETPSYDDGDFQAAVNAYLSTLETAREAGIQELQESDWVRTFLSDSTKYGWVFAGMWHRRIAQIQDSLRNAFRIYPTVNGPDFSRIKNIIPNLDGQIKANFVAAMSKAQQSIALGPIKWELTASGSETYQARAAPQLNLTASNSAQETVKSWMGGVGEHLVANIILTLMGGDRSDPDTASSDRKWVDPVMQVKLLGDKIITIAENAVDTEKITKNAARINAASRAMGFEVGVRLTPRAEAAEAQGKAAEDIWEGLGTMRSISYVGYYLGIFLPMAPFLIFTMAVIGWLIAVVESVIAAPLWMVMHMTPEADNTFVGSQKQGYFLLLSVFFRPVLMIVALMISLVMLRPVMDFLNIGFIGAMSGVQSESYTGFLSVAGFLLLYGFIVSAVFMTIFALPQEMPDRILKWISAGVGSLGEKEAVGRVESTASGSMSSMKSAGGSRGAANNGRGGVETSATTPNGPGGGGIAPGGSGGGGGAR